MHSPGGFPPRGTAAHCAHVVQAPPTLAERVIYAHFPDRPLQHCVHDQHAVALEQHFSPTGAGKSNQNARDDPQETAGDGRIPQNLFQEEIARASSAASLAAAIQRIADESQDDAKGRSLEEILGSSAVTMVDSVEALNAAVSTLAKHQVLFVDVEHHHARSYLGHCCLIQISAGDRDFVIDCIALREHIHRSLEKFFHSPSVIKVFHGAAHDVLWLQRDFGLYFVNLVDTRELACALQMESSSLAAVTKALLDIDIDKVYQKADWRRRPLPPEMLKYARADTRILACLAPLLARSILARGAEPLETARVSILRIASSVYDFPQRESASSFMRRHMFALDLSPKNLAVLDGLLQLRQRVAWEANESLSAVAHDWEILRIAYRMPTSHAELAKCSVDGLLTTVFQPYADKILALCTEAPAGGVQGRPSAARETDEKRIRVRERDIAYGEAMEAYSIYCDAVARGEASAGSIRAPDVYQICSKRSWDGQVRAWKKALHDFERTYNNK